jgi:hypothetical protein
LKTKDTKEAEETKDTKEAEETNDTKETKELTSYIAPANPLIPLTP